MITKYDNIDGLRSIAAIGIILMHVLSNGKFQIYSVLGRIIGSFGVFVKLFFIISGFGMCCGYYDKFKSGNVDLNRFYRKRYLRILPYFALLILLDVAISRFNFESIIQGFCNMTLMFGMFPQYTTTVIGVSWTLGAIFSFYILFPFFVFALWNKKRAWLFFFISIFINYVCAYYLESTGCNVALQLCYFVAGGLIYLYRDKIDIFVNKYRILSAIFVVLWIFVWAYVPNTAFSIHIETLKTLLMFSGVLCYAISVKSKLLANRITKFISEISFEIYLAHMVFYRIFEKLHMLHMFNNDLISYIVSSILVISSVIVFAYISKRVIKKMENYLMIQKNKKGIKYA